MEDMSFENNSGEHVICPVNLQSFLERGLDKEAFELIFPLFARETPERVQQCYTALRNNDLKQLRSIAHAIKGSAANVGAEQLSDTAMLLQNACDQKKPQQAAELVDELKQQWILVEAYAVEKNWLESTRCENT